MKNNKKATSQNVLTEEHIKKLYQALIEILEDRTNTKITYTIKI